jgi:D-lyxose ketol-isomerase
MKRSTVNKAFRAATACFDAHDWALPANPKWDITDFGLGDFGKSGLTIVNLATEKEYCEKLMYATKNQVTPCHTHARKKEDIICRWGELTVQLWPAKPVAGAKLPATLSVPINGVPTDVPVGRDLVLRAGSRVTLVPGVWHAFWASSAECIIGEVSTANDDTNDNFFLNPDIGRFSTLEEDEPAQVKLVSE